MKRLRVTDFGPIRQADVKFGDLTVLVGPQASGKSLFVQLYKLIEDAPAIAAELERYGFDWRDEKDPVRAFSSLYFGGGLEGIFRKSTKILREGLSVHPKRLAAHDGLGGKENVFLIPAQRVMVLQDGWPKPFMAYGAGDPYVIRRFSELIRTFVEWSRRLELEHLLSESSVRAVIDAAIFGGSKLDVRREGMRRQVVLKPSQSTSELPYTLWSAGQREFAPLLLGMTAHELLPDVQTKGIILEEPEMGLHPRAILATGLLILDLLSWSERVIILTHSPVILDLVWAIRELSVISPTDAVDALCKIFDLERPSEYVLAFLQRALTKSYRTYYFNRTESGVVTEDISSLDPGDENENIAGWGGLSGFSGRIAQIVGEAISR